MRITSQASADGVTERLFTLDGIPGVLWTPEGATGTRPLIVIGHGGGQHKKAPGVSRRAARFVTDGGFAVMAVDAPSHGDRPEVEEFSRIVAENQAKVAAGEPVGPLIASFQALVARQTVPEWRAALDAVQGHADVGDGPVGYWGISMGCGLGLPFVAAEPRVRAAVLGLGGSPQLARAAAEITIPVQFVIAWDDERVPRAESLAVFDAFASAEKTLHANPGSHGDNLPPHELDGALRFFARHLGQDTDTLAALPMLPVVS